MRQVCVNTKLWILVVFLTVGMAGYLAVEGREKKRGKEDEEENN